MVNLLWVVWTAARTEQRGARGNPLVIVGAGAQPAVLLIIALKTGPPTQGQATGLVAGVMLTAVWSTTVWMAGGVLRRERAAGTLGRCVTGLPAPYLVLVGKTLGSTLVSLTAVLSTTAAITLALRVPVRVVHPLWLLAALALLVLSATALGMLLSCLFLVTRHGLIWSGALIYPVFILGGLLIPNTALPWAFRWVPALVSLRWIHDFITRAASGIVDLAPISAAVGLSVAYYLLAWWALRSAINAALKRGSLDLA